MSLLVLKSSFDGKTVRAVCASLHHNKRASRTDVFLVMDNSRN